MLDPFRQRNSILAKVSPEARDYIRRVELADGQMLENFMLTALADFANWRIPLGGMCAALVGPRALSGALVPMVGTAPTGVNLVSGDYDRKRIQLDGVSKYIAPNRNNNADPQDSRHAAWWQYAALPGSFSGSAVGGSGNNGSTNYFFANQTSGNVRSSSGSRNFSGGSTGPGLFGVFRNTAADVIQVQSGTATTEPLGSAAPLDLTINFGANFDGAVNAEIAPSLISMGPYIDPAEMQTRSAALIAEINAALP